MIEVAFRTKVTSCAWLILCLPTHLMRHSFTLQTHRSMTPFVLGYPTVDHDHTIPSSLALACRSWAKDFLIRLSNSSA